MEDGPQPSCNGQQYSWQSERSYRTLLHSSSVFRPYQASVYCLCPVNLRLGQRMVLRVNLRFVIKLIIRARLSCSFVEMGRNDRRLLPPRLLAPLHPTLAGSSQFYFADFPTFFLFQTLIRTTTSFTLCHIFEAASYHQRRDPSNIAI